MVFGDTFKEDEDFGRSAPFFHLFHTMKKILTLILFFLIAFNAIHANITYNLSDDGTLTISGTDMPNYSYSEVPWYSQKDKIKKIIIKNGVTNIGGYAFEYCSGLTSITIPNSVMSIGEYAFDNCSGLTSVNIPNSVMSIGKGAFCSCYGLISVIIPNSVTSIGEGVFHSCKNLTSVTIPNSVTSIKEETFEGCSGLKSVIIPNSVTSIENEVFKSCSSLKSITCEANTPPSFLLENESQVFYNVDRSIPVYVPANSVDQYKAADEWKEFTNIQAIPDVNTLIDEKSFNANPSSGLVYDLNGKVINDNTPKFGIYIRNGKKVVIK